jgi:hypothetical protein
MSDERTKPLRRRLQEAPMRMQVSSRPFSGPSIAVGGMSLMSTSRNEPFSRVAWSFTPFSLSTPESGLCDSRFFALQKNDVF